MIFAGVPRRKTKRACNLQQQGAVIIPMNDRVAALASSLPPPPLLLHSWVNKLPSHCIANLGSFALDDSMPKIAEDCRRFPKIAQDCLLSSAASTLALLTLRVMHVSCDLCRRAPKENKAGMQSAAARGSHIYIVVHIILMFAPFLIFFSKHQSFSFGMWVTKFDCIQMRG